MNRIIKRLRIWWLERGIEKTADRLHKLLVKRDAISEP